MKFWADKMQDIWKFIKESDQKYESEIQKALETKETIIKKAKEEAIIVYNNQISQAKKEANESIKTSFKKFEEYKKAKLEENIKLNEVKIDKAKENIKTAVETVFRDVINEI